MSYSDGLASVASGGDADDDGDDLPHCLPIL